jgi:hypothetical protein
MAKSARADVQAVASKLMESFHTAIERCDDWSP